MSKHYDIGPNETLPRRLELARTPIEALAQGDARIAAARAALPKDPTEPLVSSAPYRSIREMGIDHLMAFEGVDREGAIAILDAPRPTPKAESDAERAARRAAERTARLRKWLTSKQSEGGSGIPIKAEMVEPVLTRTYKRTDATRAASAWLGDVSRRVMVQLGPMGVGKTVAAALVALAYASRRQTVRYLREPQLVMWSSSTTLAHETRVADALEADLLIVDEIGTTLSGNGEKARNAMFTMLDTRVAGEGRTILLGNLTEWRCARCGKVHQGKALRCVECGHETLVEYGSAEALGRAYGGRFVDRLNDIGLVVELSGESMRGRS